MSQRSKAYPQEFRRKIVELHEAGRSVVELAEEFEPCQQTIRKWIKQDQLDAGERDDGQSSEEEEIRRLRSEVRQLKEEREILKKAAAWFAQETNPTTNNGSSNS